jgi:hypothetical protein
MRRAEGAVADALSWRKEETQSLRSVEPAQAGVRIDRSVIEESNDFGAESGADRPPLAG